MYFVFYTVWDYGYATDIPFMINLKTTATKSLSSKMPFTYVHSTTNVYTY